MFPDLKRPRVIWVGLDGAAQLADLQRGVEACAERLGYPPETRPFSAHLTVGRVQNRVGSDQLSTLRAAFEQTRIDRLGCILVDSVHLMKSDLQPGGSVYTPLFRAPLGLTFPQQ